MPQFDFITRQSFGLTIDGSERDDLIIGSFRNDHINGNGGNDLILGLFGDDKMSGGDGEDAMFGGFGNDEIAANRGNDRMFGGAGDDLLVWNNGDGSDLMNGGRGHDRVQVNFNTDLVNDDLQNKDVAEFAVSDNGVQFARIEVNDQTERGLFQLDIRETETLETNFGGGDDTAVLKDDVLNEIVLDLDGGEGEDTLDLSQLAAAVTIDLASGKIGASSAVNFENVIGTDFDDRIKGDRKDNEISGGNGDDTMHGRGGDDLLIGNRGNDSMFGGGGDDMMVWNNGDGSDLMNGGRGYDTAQVNFDTDLVNDDLQNKDVASFSVGNRGIEFARIEVNDQTQFGLFELDIRKTEKLETNFGGGDDTAVIEGSVLDEIVLDLDGGDGVDLLDFSGAATAVDVDLAAGTIAAQGKVSTAVNFENVTGSAFDDTIAGDEGVNVIRGGLGNDIMSGGGGADFFVFFEEDAGVKAILDFEAGVDSLVFVTSNPAVTAQSVYDSLNQVGSAVEFTLNNKVITFEDAQVDQFHVDDFMIA